MTAFLAAVNRNWPVARWQNVRTVIACSGGADSVALVRALHTLAGDFGDKLIVAHFNHRLRGAESAGDAQFVEELAAQLQLGCEIGQVEAGLLARPGQDGIEAAARAARYEFLLRVAHQRGARYIVTAHTADDQVETALHHILRGTGLAGLAGIAPMRSLTEMTTVVRPMLDLTRADVIQYLCDLSQPFREDTTNQQTDFTRNRLRLNLLPQLEEEYNPQVREALLRLAEQASDALQLMEQLTSDWQIAGTISIDSEQCILKRPFFADKPVVLIRHFLTNLWKTCHWPRQSMSAEHWERVAKLLHEKTIDEPSSFHLPGKILVTLDRVSNCLTLQRDSAEPNAET